LQKIIDAYAHNGDERPDKEFIHDGLYYHAAANAADTAYNRGEKGSKNENYMRHLKTSFRLLRAILA